MNMNAKMHSLLQRAASESPPRSIKRAALTIEFVHDCFLLKDEYERNQHISLSDFPDKTGFECFINHLHLPYTGTSESLLSCLGYVVVLEALLIREGKGNRFRIIVGVTDSDFTVRFHQVRNGESWTSENLEDYESEAMLLIDVPD